MTNLADTQGRTRRPNILWITCEDITTFIGAYGAGVETPNIDQLSREGILYTRAHTVAGVCAPSRAAFITGMYPTAIGAHHMRTGRPEIGGSDRNAPPADKPGGLPPYSVVLPPEARAFPEYLRRAGYYTTNNQKTDYQFEAPVTVWDDNSPAASYRHRPPGMPFFSVFNLFITHESQIAMRRDPLEADAETVAVPAIYPDTPAIRADIARLYTCIRIMDRHVGEIVQQLKDDGLYDDTIIFFFSDNGGNLPWFKREILERGTHIPLIIRIPNSPLAGTRDGQLVSGVDFAPTVLSLAAVPIPPHMHGQAFLGAQQAAPPRKYVLAARDRMDSEYDRVRMVRDERYRYLYNYEPEKPYYQPLKFRLMLRSMKDILRLRDENSLPPVTARWFETKPAEELYDADHDPWELNNLAEDPAHREKLEELRAAYQDWTRAFGDLGGVPELEMVRQWWDGGDGPPTTATPQIIEGGGAVRISCATEGASVGYWIERAGRQAPDVEHVMRSWDYEQTVGEAGVKGLRTNGDRITAPQRWNVYDGEIIPLDPGDILHVNAMRIGYLPAALDYQQQ